MSNEPDTRYPPSQFAGDPLLSCFGVREYELAIGKIVCWLANHGDNWQESFQVDTFPSISPTLFAMLCAAGWIRTGYFPKGVFALSDTAIERLHEQR